jgi:hypothetical protein
MKNWINKLKKAAPYCVAAFALHSDVLHIHIAPLVRIDFNQVQPACVTNCVSVLHSTRASR